jgi:hypothetical protein
MTNIVQFPKQKIPTPNDHYDAASTILKKYQDLLKETDDIIMSMWEVNDFYLWQNGRARQRMYRNYVNIWTKIVEQFGGAL